MPEKRLSYRRLFNIPGRYEHEVIELSEDIPDFMDEAQAFKDLKERVFKLHDQSAQTRIDWESETLKAKKAQHEELKADIEEIKAWISKEEHELRLGRLGSMLKTLIQKIKGGH